MNTGLTEIPLCQNRLSIDAETAALVDEPTLANAQSVKDSAGLAELLAKRVAEPLEFPPILQSMIVGDKIAITVAHGTKNGLGIALMIVDLLIAKGHQPDDIKLVLSRADDAPSPDSATCPFEIFDPNDELQQAWLFAGVDDQSIYVCRTLFDADVVIPVGSFFGATPRDSICPDFCTMDTRKHLLNLRQVEADATINMINEQLGVFWQINVLVGPGDSIVDVLVGQRRAVLYVATKRLEEIWAVEIKRLAPLVIGTIESESEQTWEQAAAALTVADRVVADDGAIVLVSHIDSLPPAANKRNPITRLLERRHVYLFSELANPDVESSGFAPLNSSGELSRLIRQYGSATLLRDANKLDARLAPVGS